eukprot:gene3849-biopygen6576
MLREPGGQAREFFSRHANVPLLRVTAEIAAQRLVTADRAGEPEPREGSGRRRRPRRRPVALPNDTGGARGGRLLVHAARPHRAEAGEEAIGGHEVDHPLLRRDAAVERFDLLRQPRGHRGLRLGRALRRGEEPAAVQSDEGGKLHPRLRVDLRRDDGAAIQPAALPADHPAAQAAARRRSRGGAALPARAPLRPCVGFPPPRPAAALRAVRSTERRCPRLRLCGVVALAARMQRVSGLRICRVDRASTVPRTTDWSTILFCPAVRTLVREEDALGC